jgi:predicted membrane protein
MENKNNTCQMTIFGANDINFSGQTFNGGNFAAVFGGLDLDLSCAVIQEDITIVATALFGGIDIKLPPNVNCKINSCSAFGGISDKRNILLEEKFPTVFIQGRAFFGGIDLL